MSVGDQWRNRVREALLLGILYPVIRAIVTEIRDVRSPETFETSSQFLLNFLQALPAIIDVIGLGVATAIAGPIGLFGFGLEYWGVGAVFRGQEAGIWALFIGAGMIVIGSMFWDWEYLTGNGGF